MTYMTYFRRALVAVIFTSFLFPGSALAASATYDINPGSGNFTVGSTIRATITLNAQGNSINAGEGTLTFPTELLTATGISKGGIFSFWQTAPSIGNGTIRFVGGRTGSTTGTGTVFTVTFKAKHEGTARLSIQNGNILAADGEGTSVYGGSGTASWVIGPPPPDKSVPGAPQISSETHPNQEAWYNSNSPEFRWNVPNGITGTTIAFDTSSSTIPDTANATSSAISTYIHPNTPDGMSYVHVRLQNKNGWGDTGHFRVQIDVTPPVIESFELLDGTNTPQRRPLIKLTASDATSGIHNIAVQINDQTPVALVHVEDNIYELPRQTQGDKQARFIVTDNAGNSAEITKNFTVGPEAIRIVEKFKSFIPWWIWLLFILAGVAIILILLLLWFKRRKKKDETPQDKPPDSTDPPMYEVSSGD